MQRVLSFSKDKKPVYYQSSDKVKKTFNPKDFETSKISGYKLILDNEKIIKQFIDKTKSSIGSEFLPPAIRYVDYRSRFFVLEKPPSYQTVTVSKAIKRNVRSYNLETYTIPVPWQNIFVYYDHVNRNRSQAYHIRSVYLYFSLNPISNLKNHCFYRPILHNLYGNNLVCLPDLKASNSLFEMSNIVYEGVWGSSFNRDLREAFGTPLTKFNRMNRSKFVEFGLKDIILNERNYYQILSHLSIEHIMQLDYVKPTENTIALFNDETDLAITLSACNTFNAKLLQAR